MPREQALITGLSRIQDRVRFNLGMVLALAADKNKSVFTSSPTTIRQGLGHCLLWTNAYGRFFFGQTSYPAPVYAKNVRTIAI